ncbi:MAG: TetR/AcrR family transcriptional regulator [Bacteroidetes bacterium]|nr:TetR/AcrR family transcriptional regulator [Bacteroidota bacterium]
MAKKVQKPTDASTEEKIREAARKLFTQKGYASVTTREIAEEAGINLALLNYYFRSKEKLFLQIMEESMQQFIQGVVVLFNDENTSMDEKIDKLVSNYIDMLISYPDLPLFILSELRSNSNKLAMKLDSQIGLARSTFIRQIQEAMRAGKIPEVHIMHIIANMMAMMVFPFVASPLLKKIGHVNDKQFMELMQERKKLVPVWIKAMLKAR